MRAVSMETRKQKTKRILLGQCPPCSLSKKNRTAFQLAAYFRRLVETHREEGGTSPCLMLPSAMELSGFFHCSELDILDAFYELKGQAYAYEIPGLDGPILLWDPLERTGAQGSAWQTLSRIFLSPEAFHRGRLGMAGRFQASYPQ